MIAAARPGIRHNVSRLLTSPVRVTGLALEALIRNTGYETRTTGLAAEVLLSNTGYETRVTGVAAQVLIQN